MCLSFLSNTIFSSNLFHIYCKRRKISCTKQYDFMIQTVYLKVNIAGFYNLKGIQNPLNIKALLKLPCKNIFSKFDFRKNSFMHKMLLCIWNIINNGFKNKNPLNVLLNYYKRLYPTHVGEFRFSVIFEDVITFSCVW